MVDLKTLKFRYPWRPYQQRVLKLFNEYLDDKRLHIVAAPGAGKTTLGLEAFRRLGGKTLVLSPTRTIRDQWISRLADFIDGRDPQTLDWVSNDVKKIEFLTSITYQAMHSGITSDEDDELASKPDLNVFVQTLKDENIEVLIMDEAHHLRKEWWRALDQIITEIPALTLVSLTATPPYDSQSHEWQRYQQLCGPIDEEISIPELVKVDTLCAHQDFVWASDVSETEAQRLRDYDQLTKSVCESLRTSAEFELMLRTHSWMSAEPDLDSVSKNPRLALAVLSYFKDRPQPQSSALLGLLDLRNDEVPALNRRGWHTLLDGVLFDPEFQRDERHSEIIDKLKKELRAKQLLRGRELSIKRSKELSRSLALSPSKIDSCVNIHLLESRHHAQNLRQVVLTDYIRDEFTDSVTERGEPTLGAVPIFDELITMSPASAKVALLTGRVSVVHSSLLDKLLKLAERTKLTTEPYARAPEFIEVRGPLNRLTSVFTELLGSGDVNCLIGTRALLGEGWDAPSVNSLILASSVGSFMLTNQMRGRAIRVNKARPDKISSIWHLVAVDKKTRSGLEDYENLCERFNTFVGLSHMNDVIVSGFERMHADHLSHVFSSVSAERNNQQMVERYQAFHAGEHKWQTALIGDDSARVTPSVKSSALMNIKQFHFGNTLRASSVNLLLLVPAIVLLGRSLLGYEFSPLLAFFAAVGGLISLYNLPKVVRLLRVYLLHLPVDGSLRAIASALKIALCEAGILKSSAGSLRVESVPDGNGHFALSLSGGTFHESSIFADCLAEILMPIDNPRYLIVRDGEAFNLKRQDYHAVPAVLGVKKDRAELFLDKWRLYVGPSELIYTRSNLGRSRLLRAKARAFSANFKSDVEREDRWV